MKIGKYGQLQEWQEDYEEAEPGHRHISHLYGVYPGHQISWEKTPELMQAAEISVKKKAGSRWWTYRLVPCMDHWSVGTFQR